MKNSQIVKAEIQRSKVFQEKLGSFGNADFRNFVAVQVESLQQWNTLEDTLTSTLVTKATKLQKQYRFIHNC